MSIMNDQVIAESELDLSLAIQRVLDEHDKGDVRQSTFWSF
jgi:hypothetical protein